MCVFQIKLTGQLYVQMSSAHMNIMCHFSLAKFSRVKTTVPLTPRVSLSFSQKSCSGPKWTMDRLVFAIRSKRSPGAKQFATEPSGVGLDIQHGYRGQMCFPYPGHRQRKVVSCSGTPTRTSSIPCSKRGVICPARTEHTPLLKPSSVPP